MGKFSCEEIEGAFQNYWQTGAVNEDWDGFADLFSEDVLYVEHVLGTMTSREQVRTWIKPIMERHCELYTAYEWHTVDAERDSVVVYMQNRRDHPCGTGSLDFPGITIVHYAGDGLFDSEEDFWSVPGAEQTLKAYREACAEHDPDHPQKRTRRNWGSGPGWTQGAASWFDRAGSRC